MPWFCGTFIPWWTAWPPLGSNSKTWRLVRSIWWCSGCCCWGTKPPCGSTFACCWWNPMGMWPGTIPLLPPIPIPMPMCGIYNIYWLSNWPWLTCRLLFIIGTWPKFPWLLANGIWSKLWLLIAWWFWRATCYYWWAIFIGAWKLLGFSPIIGHWFWFYCMFYPWLT